MNFLFHGPDTSLAILMLLKIIVILLIIMIMIIINKGFFLVLHPVRDMCNTKEIACTLELNT